MVASRLAQFGLAHQCRAEARNFAKAKAKTKAKAKAKAQAKAKTKAKAKAKAQAKAKAKAKANTYANGVPNENSNGTGMISAVAAHHPPQSRRIRAQLSQCSRRLPELACARLHPHWHCWTVDLSLALTC